MATPAQRTNTWTLDEWYDQAVAGTQGDYSGVKTFWAWGDKNYGVLANNQSSGPGQTTPLQISGTTWETLGADAQAGSYGCAIKSDGTLWVWGANAMGTLGQNQIDSGLDGASSPIQIGSGTDWANVSSGYGGNTVIATKTDGTLWNWGRNRYGELGQNQGQSNNNNSRSSPTQMGTDSDWATGYGKIAGGNMSQFAIKTDGTLWGWGSGPGGYLGQNNTTEYSSPVQVGTNTNWNTLGNGFYAGMGSINTDGELYMWGYNNWGQLGHNNNTTYSSPLQIPGTWSNFSCALAETGAVKTDGTLWVWGKNSQGALGQNEEGEPASRSSPTQIPGTWATGELKLFYNGQAGRAIKTDGTLWSWGKGDKGQLGDGSTTNRSSPVQVGTETDWYRVSGSADNTVLAFKLL